MTIKWRFMNKGDLADVCKIADVCHPDYPEDPVVLGQKQALAPQTCYILEKECKACGYILAHPWTLHNIPPLNQLLNGVPQAANILYLHDIALLPEVRQGGTGAQGLKLLYGQAKNLGFDKIALVAVNNSSSFWQYQGFVKQTVNDTLQQKLLTYSMDALYMLKAL